jgi:uncharacterized protein with FMN-binding domain
MKVTKSLALIFGVAMLLSVMAFAKDKANEANVEVPEAVQVGSTTLQPGTYKVQWNGTGDNVQVNFLMHHKTVATTQATLAENQTESPYTDVVTEKGANNQKQLVEIDFSKSKQVLKLNANGANANSQGQM